MTDQPDRPVALRVIPENIPAELKARKIWCNMRYEWNGKKWGKVPYTPFTTSKASSTRESSWRTFDEAYACLLERGDFFDGLFICLSANDPYTGGDFDHTDDQSRIPYTYAERSVGGNGSRFIGRGTIPSACKKPEGELYTAKRFLSITGHRLDGFPCDIRPIQPELDKLYEELKGTERALREGKPGSGDRAALAAAHADEWEAARIESRTNLSSLLAELRRRATSNKTGKRDTMLAYLLNKDYTGFHNKWPHVGIVRSDGTIDNSQIRCVMSNAIKGRGFSFPQFVALMGYFYGEECLKKWGYMKERVQEEFATLWHISRSPRVGDYQPRVEQVKRGRGSDHAELLERAYQALTDFKVGAQAFLTQQDLADALNVNRRTAITLMQELARAERITYQAVRGNAGLVVNFGGTVINTEISNGNIPHSNGVNRASENDVMSAECPNGSTVINSTVPFVIETPQTCEIDAPMSADEQEMADLEGVINDVERESELTALECGETLPATAQDERERTARLIGIYNIPVSLSVDTITPQNRPTLKDAVIDALDNLDKSRPDEVTGELHRWLITEKRVIEFVQYEYSERGWKPDAIAFWYRKVRKARKSETFDDLRGMTRDALEKKHASLQKEITRYERKAASDPDPMMRPWWAGRANSKRGALSLHAGELDRRNAADRERIATEGYSEGEQAEMLELVAQVAIAKPARKLTPALSPVEATGIVERLRQAKIARTA